MAILQQDLPGSGAATRAPVNVLEVVVSIFLIVGGLNWGLVGLFNFDLVAALLGPMSLGSRVVYVLVGLAAIVGIVTTAKQLQRNR